MLVFSVTPFKIDQEKSKLFNRLSEEPGKRKKVNMQTLTKMQFTAFFYAREKEKFFTQIFRDFYGDADGHQDGDRKPTKTFVAEFCYKSVNLSREELKNIRKILLLIHELFR